MTAMFSMAFIASEHASDSHMPSYQATLPLTEKLEDTPEEKKQSKQFGF